MFTGCGTALVTPFQNDFSLDEVALRRLCGGRSRLESISRACGTTAKPHADACRAQRVVEITLEEAHGKVPVVAGAAARHSGSSARRANMKRWASAAFFRRAYYNKPRRKACTNIFTSLPVPSRCRSCCTTSGPHGSEHRACHGEAAIGHR